MQDALKSVFAWFWREFGFTLGIKLPIEADLTAAAIRKAAQEEKLIRPRRPQN